MYAFWTPFPPTRSGTADYALALVKLLAPRVPITVVVADDQYTAASRDLARKAGAHLIAQRDYPHLEPHVSLDVYFVANNGFHTYLFRQVEERPGLLVLHENATSYAYWLLVHRDQPEMLGRWGGNHSDRFAEEVRRVYPEQPRVLGAWMLGSASYVVPMTDSMVAASLAVVVHNPVLAKRLAVESGRRVSFVPHPPLPAVPAEARERAWAELSKRLPDRPLLFGSLGFVGWYKRLPQVMRAYGRFCREDPALAGKTAFVVAGQMDPHVRSQLQAIQESEGLGGGQWVELPYLSEAELEALLARLDLVLNLRYPSCGEASGMLTRCLQLGKPTVVSDHAYGGSMPDDVVLKVSPVAGEEAALARIFQRRAGGETLLDAARVQRFAEVAFDPGHFTNRFGTCLESAREPETQRV